MPAGNLRERLAERGYLQRIFDRDVDIVGDQAALAAVPRRLELWANRDLRTVARDALGGGDNFRRDVAELPCGERSPGAACEEC